jgi:hypothetical protein
MSDLQFSEDELYRDLIIEVLRILGYPKDMTPSNIKGKGLDDFCTELGKYIGCNAKMDQKTIRKHLQDQYDEGMLNNSLFAAAWLIDQGLLTSDQVGMIVTSTSKKNLPFWMNYVRYVKNPSLINLKLAEIADKQMPAKKLHEMFSNFNLVNIYQRPSLIANFVRLSLSSPIIKVEGMSGCGKTYFIKSIEKHFKSTGQYANIFWKPVFKGYTLDVFVKEFEQYISLGTMSPNLSKAIKICEYLQSSHSLLVFQNMEGSDDESFRDFFEFIGKRSGRTRIIIISNFSAKFSFIRPSQTFLIKSYNTNELQELLRQNAIVLDQPAFDELLKKTDGIPVYVWTFVEQVAYDSDALNNLLDLPDVKNWANRNLSKLSDDEQRLLHCLSVYNDVFSLQTADAMGLSLRIKQPRDSFFRLRDNFFIESTGDGILRICGDSTYLFENQFNLDQISIAHEAIGDYLWPYNRFADGDSFSIENLLTILRAITHFQKAGTFKKSQRYLLKIIDTLKKKGLNHYAISCIQGEPPANLQNNPWLVWHCAHCYYITGAFWKSIELLRDCMEIAFLRMKNEKRNEDLTAFFLKSVMLFAEIAATALSYTEGIALLTAGLSMFQPDELEFNLKMHALSILSWFYLRTGAEEESMSINQNILADSFATNEQSKGVANARIGIIHLRDLNVAAAEQSLSSAIKSFRDFDDKRGLCWSLRWWLKCQTYKEPLAEIPVNLMDDVLQYAKESDLFADDYFEWLKEFDEKVSDNYCKGLLNAEIERVSLKLHELTYSLEQESLIKTVRQILARIDPPHSFNYRIYNKPFVQSSLPSDSKAIHSFINKVAKNPIFFLENLFIKDAKTVFASYQNNKVIGELIKKCSGEASQIIDTYIKPNLQLIKDRWEPDDSIKFHYARILQYAGAVDESLLLLMAVRQENYNFNFFNISANCYRKKRNFR